MKYNQPFGIVDANAVYINGNPSTGTMGSIPPAEAIEYPQRELVNFFVDSGLTATNDDLHQLSKSAQSGAVNYAVDAGTANNVLISMTPTLLAYKEGMPLWVKIATSNTGAATINVNSVGGRNIVRRGGGALVAGDLQGGYFALLVYNSTHNNFELYSVGYDATTGIPALAANSDLYVNASTGSDTLYDGTAATVSGGHGPFATIQKAVDKTFTYGPSAYIMTIHVANGTYNEAVATPTFPGPGLVIVGASKTSTIVTGAFSHHTFMCQGPNSLTVRTLKASANRSGDGPPCCFVAQQGGSLYTDDCTSGISALAEIFLSYGGFLYIGQHSFDAGSSSGGAAMASFFNGFMAILPQKVITFGGAFSCSQFAAVQANGSIAIPDGANVPSFTNTGAVTGQRYSASFNGIIGTNGAGVNFFPGNSAGATSTGGQYY